MGQYLSCISLTSLLIHQHNLIGFLFLCWCTVIVTSLEIHFFYSGFTPIFFQLAWGTVTNYCGEDRLWITILSDSKAGNKLQYMESIWTVYQRITSFSDLLWVHVSSSNPVFRPDQPLSPSVHWVVGIYMWCGRVCICVRVVHSAAWSSSCGDICCFNIITAYPLLSPTASNKTHTHKLKG